MRTQFAKFTNKELIRLQDYIHYEDEMYEELQQEFRDRIHQKEVYADLDRCNATTINKEFSIGGSTMIRLTKKDLIEAINKTFPDDFGSVAVLTECKTTDYDTKMEIITQSITFGKSLKL